MHTQTSAPIAATATGCCPVFDPAPWLDKEIVWHEREFVVDHVTRVLHVPLDFGRKVTKNQRLIEAACARPAAPIMLSDESSPWGGEIFIAVDKPVPGARMAKLSGTFLTRVYEGPYRDAGRWAEDMRAYVASKGRALEKLYFGYTTCPRCAKAYGKNYVVLFARVAPRAAS